MKNKKIASNFLIAILFSGLASCDSDLPVYEKGNLIGSYTGTCTISTSSASEIVSNFPADFSHRDVESLYLKIGDGATYDSVGISTMRIASGFKDYGSYARFDLDGINDKFTTDLFPNFIKNSTDWEIKSMTLNLDIDPKNPPKYTVASKNLTFTYTGTFKITGTKGDEQSRPVSYTFNLNKNQN